MSGVIRTSLRPLRVEMTVEYVPLDGWLEPIEWDFPPRPRGPRLFNGRLRRVERPVVR